MLQGGARTLERCRPIVVSEVLTRDEQANLWGGARRVPPLVHGTGLGLNVIEEETGQLRSFPTPEALVEWWPASLHGEDLLLIPSSDCR